MIRRNITVAAIVALAATTPAEAGFWTELKRSFGAAVDGAKRDGAKAVDAVGAGASQAADAVAEGAESAADLVTGDPAAAEAEHVDHAPVPAAAESKRLAKQPTK